VEDAAKAPEYTSITDRSTATYIFGEEYYLEE
jgi:hypothetical protein